MLDTRPSLLSSYSTDSVDSGGTTFMSNVYFVLDSFNNLCSQGLRQMQTVAQCDKERLALHLVVHRTYLLLTTLCYSACHA